MAIFFIEDQTKTENTPSKVEPMYSNANSEQEQKIDRFSLRESSQQPSAIDDSAHGLGPQSDMPRNVQQKVDRLGRYACYYSTASLRSDTSISEERYTWVSNSYKIQTRIDYE